MNPTEIIEKAISLANLNGYKRSFTELGGGEVNNTFKLDFENEQLIMRIARDKGQSTLKFESEALKQLDLPNIPKLVYFDIDETIDGYVWIIESYVRGTTPERLTKSQFNSLGKLLAQIHKVRSDDSGLDVRHQFFFTCRNFGNEDYVTNHPDAELRTQINAILSEMVDRQTEFSRIIPCLIHSDATPSNVLVEGNEVALIDWEFSKYSDPLCDFPTMYYEDIEYNQGKWRIKISEEEKAELFKGYTAGGGEIDEDRIRFWIRYDKITSLIFLYWRINQSSRETSQTEMDQYKLDYEALLSSLKNS
jgi:aminoglycoside phosphotransferase (APT) family kinase protein